MEKEKGILGISENLADSITDQKVIEEKQTGKTILIGKRIAISVSESEELEYLGLSDHHLKDISIEIARYLIVNGATMIYGGDLREKGFTELFQELSYQYKYLDDKKNRFVNYFAFPTARKLTDNDKATFLQKQVDLKIIEAPKHLGNLDPQKLYDPSKNIEDKFLFAECFSGMRVKMAHESDARIVLGGRQKGFTGYFPGIIEETFYSLQAGKPIYILGGFGGASKTIIDVLMGKNPEQLTNDFQYNTEFLKEFKTFASAKTKINLDYHFLVDFFKKYPIEYISKKNGLTIEENLILFESTNIHELVFLLIKGLKNFFG